MLLNAHQACMAKEIIKEILLELEDDSSQCFIPGGLLLPTL